MRISDWISDVCSSDLCRRLDCRIQVIAGQENAIAVGFVNRASDFLPERPDKDGIAVGGRDLGQGRAPCTRADYANSHAFNPAPRAFSAQIGRAWCRASVWSSVQISVVAVSLKK